jgi:hypothetical protein
MPISNFINFYVILLYHAIKAHMIIKNQKEISQLKLSKFKNPQCRQQNIIKLFVIYMAIST